jgi:hypothetical protein
MNRWSVLGHVARDFRSGWKQLALTDLVYKLVAFVLLTPLVGILFRVLLAAAGKDVLADQDILFFFLRPVGWLCGIAVGGLWLAIVALEQAALMAVLCANQGQRRVGVIAAIQFAGTKAWPVLRVTARMVGISLLRAAPYLAMAGFVYLVLLREFDINYYLQKKPPVFLVALGIAGILAVDRRLGLGILGAVCRGDIHRLRNRPFLGASSRGHHRTVGARHRHHSGSLGRRELGGESAEHDQLRRDRVQPVPSARA